MRTFFVVIGHPVVDELPDLGERIENVGVEHFGTEGSVEALDIGVLGGFAGLDVMEADMVTLAPSRQFGGDEFRAVIDPDLGR